MLRYAGGTHQLTFLPAHARGAFGIVTGINTAASDYVPYAQLATTQLLQTVPFGKYHARTGQDGQDKLVDQKPGQKADTPSTQATATPAQGT